MPRPGFLCGSFSACFCFWMLWKRKREEREKTKARERLSIREREKEKERKKNSKKQTLDAVASTTVIGSPPSALCTRSILVVCFHAFFPSSAPRIVPWLEKTATCSPRSAHARRASGASRRKNTKSPGLAGPRDRSRRQEAPSTTRVPSCFRSFFVGFLFSRGGEERKRGMRVWERRGENREGARHALLLVARRTKKSVAFQASFLVFSLKTITHEVKGGDLGRRRRGAVGPVGREEGERERDRQREREKGWDRERVRE